MSSALSVFVSSTFLDLRDHRAAVIRSLLDAGFHPVGMENFMARPEEPAVACLDEVVQSDLFVGIYAWRYGFVPPGSEVSITEQELLKAQEAGRPCFCFFVDEGHSWPDQFREAGPGAELLRALKARIGSGRVVTWFTTPEILAGKVIASLHRHVASRAKPVAAVTPERRDLLLLLDKVEGAWLRDVLERSAPESRRIELELEEKAGLVESPSASWQEPAVPSLLSGKAILDLFLEREQSLLIVGGAGSGKTTTLLLLAQGLASQARSSSEAPVPVVLNLASWAERQLPLEEWMAQEVRARYQTGEKAARLWLEGHRILPLLDGLDEVEPGCRGACVDAINAWLADHGLHGVALCCRARIYEELPHRLQLQAAVAVQPLSPAKVEEYASASPGGEILREQLAGDPELQELAKVPQLLSLLEQACRDGATVATGTGSLEQRRGRLFDGYVGVRLKRRPSRDFPQERTLQALSWLAQRMKEHGTSLFQLEQLQPSWLPVGRWSYFLVSRMLGGLLLGTALALLLPTPPVILGDLVTGMGMGGLDALWERRRRVRAEPSDGLWGWLRRSVLAVASYGVIAFVLLFGPMRNSDSDLDLYAYAVVFGLVFGLRSSERNGRHDIQFAEEMRWSRWSKRGALMGMLVGATLGFFVVWLSESSDWTFDISLVCIGLAIGAGSGGLLGAFQGRAIAKKSLPNQGMRLTLKSSAFVLATVALAVTLVNGVLGIALGQDELAWPVRFGTAVGLSVALWFGGLDVLYHFVLRALLRLRGYAPADYVGFLNYAADSGLLLRSGGSYLFFYGQPMLEHLASSSQ